MRPLEEIETDVVTRRRLHDEIAAMHGRTPHDDVVAEQRRKAFEIRETEQRLATDAAHLLADATRLRLLAAAVRRLLDTVEPTTGQDLRSDLALSDNDELLGALRVVDVVLAGVPVPTSTIQQVDFEGGIAIDMPPERAHARLERALAESRESDRVLLAGEKSAATAALEEAIIAERKEGL